MGNCQNNICYNDKSSSAQENILMKRTLSENNRNTKEKLPDMKLKIKDEDHSKTDLEYWKQELYQLNKITLENGGFFQGEILDNKRNGFGILELKDGTRYEGREY